jgi:hypothetical protein
MNVICLEEKAFDALIEKVYKQVRELYDRDHKSKWISPQEAMKKLNVTSKTTLQKYRDHGEIRYSELSPRSFLYDTDSIDEFLKRRARDPFKF